MPKKLTQGQFIQKAISVHGDKYDYSKVEYLNSQTKVCIICPVHGEFLIRPNDHLRGQGCNKCKLVKLSKIFSSTNNDFIRKVKEVHGDKYDYSKVEYVNNRIPVCIICPVHGEFWQKPYSHLSGCGCKLCNGGVKRTKEDFIKKANIIHNNFYTYNDVEYIDSKTYVYITCPKHGNFKQTPDAHLTGRKCPYCNFENLSEKYRMGKNEFIKRANKIYNNVYDYSKVNYVNNQTKVCIICPIHGEFYREPWVHIKGGGCQKCNLKKLEMETYNKLIEEGINYETQKKFDWLKYKDNLRLDFYLSDYNIAIECQGGQHFETIDYFGGEEGFMNTQKRDKIKKKLCEEHGIKLLYYTNIKEYNTFLGEKVYHDINELLIENSITNEK